MQGKKRAEQQTGTECGIRDGGGGGRGRAGRTRGGGHRSKEEEVGEEHYMCAVGGAGVQWEWRYTRVCERGYTRTCK